mmetsp:Transcript_1439/g.3188  ORF Transcript_1439/g.3188 Transcript_1439/m.3188 type:complete len:324 (-) Transcript_1439:223-1194(-)
MRAFSACRLLPSVGAKIQHGARACIARPAITGLRHYQGLAAASSAAGKIVGVPRGAGNKVKPTFDPEAWTVFSAYNSEPFADLVSLVEVKEGLRVIDLGCGVGDLTFKLAAALPSSTVIGIDTSERMIEAAKSNENPRGIHFEVGDMAEVQGEYDLIFSKSSLQFSGDQIEMTKKLYKCLRPGGQIVVQVPSMNNPFFQILETASRIPPYADVLEDNVDFFPPLTPQGYSQALLEEGAMMVVAFEKSYPIRMDNADHVLRWLQSGAMVPYTQALARAQNTFQVDMAEDFTGMVRSALRSAMPGSPVEFRFNRVMFSAFRPPSA